MGKKRAVPWLQIAVTFILYMPCQHWALLLSGLLECDRCEEDEAETHTQSNQSEKWLCNPARHCQPNSQTHRSACTQSEEQGWTKAVLFYSSTAAFLLVICLSVHRQENMYRGCKTRGDRAGYKSSRALVPLKAKCTHIAAVFQRCHKFFPITKYIRRVIVVHVIYVSAQKWEVFLQELQHKFIYYDWSFNRNDRDRKKSRFLLPKCPQRVDLFSSSSLIWVSQVRGWWVNIGVRAWISMEGMNYSSPAPLIYFPSNWEKQEKERWVGGKGDARQTWSFKFIFISTWPGLSSYGQSFHYKTTLILYFPCDSRSPLQIWSILQDSIFPLQWSRTSAYSKVSSKQMASPGSVCCSVATSKRCWEEQLELTGWGK